MYTFLTRPLCNCSEASGMCRAGLASIRSATGFLCFFVLLILLKRNPVPGCTATFHPSYAQPAPHSYLPTLPSFEITNGLRLLRLCVPHGLMTYFTCTTPPGRGFTGRALQKAPAKRGQGGAGDKGALGCGGVREDSWPLGCPVVCASHL